MEGWGMEGGEEGEGGREGREGRVRGERGGVRRRGERREGGEGEEGRGGEGCGRGRGVRGGVKGHGGGGGGAITERTSTHSWETGASPEPSSHSRLGVLSVMRCSVPLVFPMPALTPMVSLSGISTPSPSFFASLLLW